MHIVNRVIGTLLALTLLLGGLLAAIEIVLAAIGRPYWLVPHEQWSSWLGDQTFADGVVRAVLSGLVIVGLLLLFVALRRGKPGTLQLPGRVQGVRVTASRRGIERSVSTAVHRANGVRSAEARAGRRSIRVKAATAMRNPGDLQQSVQSAVTDRIDDLGLTGVLRPRVTVTQESAR